MATPEAPTPPPQPDSPQYWEQVARLQTEVVRFGSVDASQITGPRGVDGGTERTTRVAWDGGDDAVWTLQEVTARSPQFGTHQRTTWVLRTPRPGDDRTPAAEEVTLYTYNLPPTHRLTHIVSRLRGMRYNWLRVSPETSDRGVLADALLAQRPGTRRRNKLAVPTVEHYTTLLRQLGRGATGAYTLNPPVDKAP